MDQILNFFISSAYAQDASSSAATQQGGSLSFMLMFAGLFVLMYFMILRPQSKRAKQQQGLVNSLAKGDEVITAGGVLGKITKIKDQYISLSLANNVEVVVQKASVVSLLPKGTLKSLE